MVEGVPSQDTLENTPLSVAHHELWSNPDEKKRYNIEGETMKTGKITLMALALSAPQLARWPRLSRGNRPSVFLLSDQWC